MFSALLKISRGKAMALCAAALSVAMASGPAEAAGPGRGPTGQFETDYLKFVIDHHFTALRMSELAAGTDATRDAQLSPAEGTASTPQTDKTAAKAQSDEIKSMARRENRMQREEILKAQHFLRDWYGVNYQPHVRPEGQTLINTLQSTAAGTEFDKAFLRSMSTHHYMILNPTMQCLTGADVAHGDLERYCTGIATSQVLAIDDMRHMLCEQYADCTFQPFTAAPAASGSFPM